IKSCTPLPYNPTWVRTVMVWFCSMDFKKELARKSLHLPGLFFLFLGKYRPLFSVVLLAALIFLYLISLWIRSRGGRGIPLVSNLTERLQRNGGKDGKAGLPPTLPQTRGVCGVDWGPPLLATG